MANVARVEIEATVPWCWASEMPAEDVAMFLPIFMNPVYGLRAKFEEDGYVPNEHGGRTHMYRLTIFGEEAIWGSTVEAMVEALNEIGTVIFASHTDLEWDPEDIRTWVIVKRRRTKSRR